MKTYSQWNEEKHITDDELQNELILILHHIGDIRETLKEKDIKYALEGLKDIEYSVKRMEKFLSKNQSKEVKRATDNV
jgi:hypothetical protein